MSFKMNLRKYLPLADIVPEAISTLSFKIDQALTPVTLLVYNKGRYEEITGKNTDSEGVFSIQVVATEDDPADIESYWFNRYAGPFYFQISVGGEFIPVATNFEGVVFEFKNVIGADPDYLIDLSTGEVVTPPDGSGIGTMAIGSTFIIG